MPQVGGVKAVPASRKESRAHVVIFVAVARERAVQVMAAADQLTSSILGRGRCARSVGPPLWWRPPGPVRIAILAHATFARRGIILPSGTAPPSLSMCYCQNNALFSILSRASVMLTPAVCLYFTASRQSCTYVDFVMSRDGQGERVASSALRKAKHELAETRSRCCKCLVGVAASCTPSRKISSGVQS